MNNSVYNISLDLHAVGSQLTLNAKAYDTARTIRCTLTENGKPYTISEGCYAAFTAKKPDGNVLFNATTIDDAINYEFTVNTVNAPGEVECEIRLYDGNGKLITSPRLTILVDDTVYHDGDVVESSSEFTALTDLMSSVIRVLGEVPSPVLYGMMQSLSDEQKAQARENIGAADMEAVEAAVEAADAAERAADTAAEAALAAVEAVDDIPQWAKQETKPDYQANEIDYHTTFLGEEVGTVDDALAVAEDEINRKLDKPEVLMWDKTVYPTLLDFLKTITVPGKYKFVDPIDDRDCEYELILSTAAEDCYFGKLKWYASEITGTRMFVAVGDISYLHEVEDIRPATMNDVEGKQDKLTAGERISIDSNNVISADEQVFIVTADINTTDMTISNASHTFAELAAAYDAKKIVILRAGFYEFAVIAKTSSAVQFASHVGAITYTAIVRNTGVWTVSKVEKVNEIIDSATNSQYPSALAVVNYVNSVIGNVSAALSAMDAVIGGDEP